MTGIGLYKDFYSQEYLEELIRLTFPAAKVNNIVPFTKYIKTGSGNAIAQQENILYYTQVQFFAGSPATDILQLTLLNDVSLLDHDADFLMYQALSINGVLGTAVLTGYKITLDNTIKNLQDVEEPPVIVIISGRIKNPVWFYSNNINNSNGNVSLSMIVETEGTTNAVEISHPGFFVQLDATDGIITLVNDNAADIAGAFQVMLRGTLSPDYNVFSNTITQNFNGPLKHYNMPQYNGGWDVLTNTYQQPFNNCTIGDVIHGAYVNPFGVVLDEQTVTVPHSSFKMIFNNIPAHPQFEPFNSTHIRVTPTIQGKQCPFYFIEYISGV